eukprot:SAG11_NODE_11830_length_736_cov_1.219780_2_plen_88_part_01
MFAAEARDEVDAVSEGGGCGASLGITLFPHQNRTGQIHITCGAMRLVPKRDGGARWTEVRLVLAMQEFTFPQGGGDSLGSRWPSTDEW